MVVAHPPPDGVDEAAAHGSSVNVSVDAGDENPLGVPPCRVVRVIFAVA